jgi:hypothetical protein
MSDIKSSLRGDVQEKRTKLAILDCTKMTIAGYDGRFKAQKATIVIDDDTTAEYMKEAIDGFRLSSDEETTLAERELEKKELIASERLAYTEAEYASWFPIKK